MLQFPILDVLLHPPYGAMRRELIAGTFSGTGNLTRATGSLPPFNNVNAYGLRVSFFTVPAELGYLLGSPNQYYDRMVELTARYSDALGNDDDLEVVNIHFERVWIWAEPGPALIHYDILPGVSCVFEWMIVKFP
jgi:hypothetical protein